MIRCICILLIDCSECGRLVAKSAAAAWNSTSVPCAITKAEKAGSLVIPKACALAARAASGLSVRSNTRLARTISVRRKMVCAL